MDSPIYNYIHLLIIQYLVCCFRRVSSTPDNLLVAIAMSAITSSSSKRSTCTTDQKFRHCGSSEVRNRVKKNIPLDVTSKGTLSFHNISYTIIGRQEYTSWKNWRAYFMKSESKKQIIDDVSGLFTPGMNAIMGKSHCFR